MEVCNCSMFCCTLLYVHSSIAIILMGKRELIALLNLSSWCLVMVERLFLATPQGCLQFVIVVFPDYTHLLFLNYCNVSYRINNLIKFTHYDERNKRANDAQIVIAKKTLKLSKGWPSLRQASDTNPPIKAIRQS